jgi:polyhydroxyalkanoate synthase
MEHRQGEPAFRQSLHADLIAEQQRMLRRMLQVPRVVELAYETRVGTTPHDVVFERAPIKLIRYRRDTPATQAEPVLFCYALINRPYILDLLPGKSVVGRYLERGFDVYMIDWGIPSDADRGLSLETYVCQFLADAVAFILEQHHRKDLHLLGYCMGGTMSALFAAMNPEPIKSLTLLAAPIGFDKQESLLQLWTDPQHFDVDSFINTHGNCPAWFLQSCFLWMKPIQNFVEKTTALFEQMDDLEMVAHYFAMERWINDNVPVAGETFRDFVKKLYQRNELVRGQLHLGDRRVDLRQITCPLLLLTATKDHLVAPSSTEAIRPYVASQDVRSMSIEAGHVGLVVGGQAHRKVWPESTRWLAERSTTTPHGRSAPRSVAPGPSTASPG